MGNCGTNTVGVCLCASASYTSLVTRGIGTVRGCEGWGYFDSKAACLKREEDVGCGKV